MYIFKKNTGNNYNYILFETGNVAKAEIEHLYKTTIENTVLIQTMARN